MKKIGKISRRSFLIFSALAGLASVGRPIFAAEQLDYEYLRLNLYPKTEPEKKYLSELATLIKTKKVPQKLVYMALKSTMKKPKSSRFCYFAETLDFLCKRSGVKLTLKTPT